MYPDPYYTPQIPSPMPGYYYPPAYPYAPYPFMPPYYPQAEAPPQGQDPELQGEGEAAQEKPQIPPPPDFSGYRQT